MPAPSRSQRTTAPVTVVSASRQKVGRSSTSQARYTFIVSSAGADSPRQTSTNEAVPWVHSALPAVRQS